MWIYVVLGISENTLMMDALDICILELSEQLYVVAFPSIYSIALRIY